MPIINVQPRDMQDGTRITYFNDSVGTSSTTYTFNANQEMIMLRNKGTRDLNYTIGATSGVLGRGELIKLNGNFSSMILSSAQGTQAFEVISDEIGTISGSSDYTNLASQVAERVKTVNGIAPDGSGNVVISTGSGEGSLVYATLAALQSAYPNGTTQPAWVTADNAWYYWNGVVVGDTTPPNNVTGVNATSITQTSMVIGWTAVSDAASYEVWKNSVLDTTVSTNSYNATGLVADTSYSWIIKAKDTAGNTASGSTPLVQNTLAEGVPPVDTTPPVLTITPAGTFTDTQTVTMSTNETATIYYTLDDTDPKTSGTKLTYTTPLTLTATDTIKAYAKDSANNESAVQTVTYTKQISISDATNSVLYLTAKQGSGNTLTDYSVNTHDATLTGFNNTTSSGWNSPDLVFDGVDDLFSISGLTDMAVPDGSVELYFKPFNTLLSNNEISYFLVDGGGRFSLWRAANHADNQLTFTLGYVPTADLSAKYNITLTFVIDPTINNHVVLTWNTTTKVANVYLNGSNVKTQTQSSANNYEGITTSLKNSVTTANAGKQNFRYLKLYNRTLSSSDVTTYYNDRENV